MSDTLSKGPTAPIHERIPSGCRSFPSNEFAATPHTRGSSTTTIIDFANQTRGETLHAAVDEWHKKAAGNALCDYGFHVSVTDFNPTTKAEIKQLIDDGIQVFEKIGSQALVGQHPAGGNEFWITLKPQVFGGLQLRISINLEGEVSASMIAPTHAIKHTLKRHLPALRRHLQKKGHKVGKVEVIVKSSEDAEEDD